MNPELDIPARAQNTTRSSPGARTALVFGATGFIGRWLIKELLAQGIPTAAAVRSSALGGRLALGDLAACLTVPYRAGLAAASTPSIRRPLDARAPEDAAKCG